MPTKWSKNEVRITLEEPLVVTPSLARIPAREYETRLPPNGEARSAACFTLSLSPPTSFSLYLSLSHTHTQTHTLSLCRARRKLVQSYGRDLSGTRERPHTPHSPTSPNPYPSLHPLTPYVVRRTPNPETFFLLSFFFNTLSLELSDTKVYEPEIRALLGSASHLCEAIVLKRTRIPLSRSWSRATEETSLWRPLPFLPGGLAPLPPDPPPSTLNPQLNFKPQTLFLTLNPTPCTLTPRPSTLNSQP